MSQLIRIEVQGMLGRFNHVVEFPSSWEFVILHGPNGVGKTKLLELVSNTFNFQVSRLVNTPFHSARFDFSDGHKLKVTRVKLDRPKIRKTSRSHLPDRSGKNTAVLQFGVHFELRLPKGGMLAYTSTPEDNRGTAHLRDLVASMLPVSRIGPNEYIELDGDSVLTFSNVLEMYGHLLPADVYPEGEQPKELREFLGGVDVYLIETQRLLNIPVNQPTSRYVPGQRPEPPKSRVALYSEDLARQLKEALAHNSRRSQELDRRFPEHLLQEEPAVDTTDEQIRERYNRQAEYRARLAEIDVLGASTDYLPLPDRELKDWERHVLWTYLEDTELKLETFRDLLTRVRLLQEIVNSRFKYKSLEISREHGFKIVTDNGQEISADRLSSGEQHELVLVYGLLFKVHENTLVLIDEPEISLHVGWQRQFLSDLFEISQVTKLRFVIATHSPQIIHKWWERTIPLVPAEEMDD